MKNLLRLSNNEKYRILNYLKNLEQVGNLYKGISLKEEEYTKRKMKGPLSVITKIKKEMNNGQNIINAMHDSSLINDQEKEVFLKARDFPSAIDQILDTREKKSKSIIGFLLILMPIGGILLLLLFSQESVLKILTDMSKPMIDAGATPAPIPAYMKTNTIYLLGNIVFFSIVSIFFVFLKWAKYNSPKIYFKTIPIFEEEYSLNLTKIILSMIKSGMSFSEAIKTLQKYEKDPIFKKIFTEITEDLAQGKMNISEILENNGINYSTTSLIKMGEDSGKMIEALTSAHQEIKERYERDISIFLKSALWIGQIGMILIALKPMIDIMLLTSIGQLNFKLNQ